jgi:hypothetical protein
MPLPDRPVANTTIDSEWGQAVHDWLFAPKGCESSGGSRTVSNTAGGLRVSIDTAVSDPGGFVDTVAGHIEVPTGADALYLINLVLDSVNGTSTDEVRAFIYVNGTAYAHALEDSAGGTHVRVGVTAVIALTAGDIIEVYAQKKGSGTNPTVYVQSLQVVALGHEYGA